LGRIKLKKPGVAQRIANLREIALHQVQQLDVANVSGRNQKQFLGPVLCQQGVYEIGIFGNEHALFGDAQAIEGTVGCGIAIRKIKRVNRIMLLALNQTAQPSWQLCIDEKFHASARWMRLMATRREAKLCAASKSSRSKSGKSASISSYVIPLPNHSSTVSTGYLRPRMTGLPWQISESIVMRLGREDVAFTVAGIQKV
jgi:hypothetical protein